MTQLPKEWKRMAGLGARDLWLLTVWNLQGSRKASYQCFRNIHGNDIPKDIWYSKQTKNPHQNPALLMRTVAIVGLVAGPEGAEHVFFSTEAQKGYFLLHGWRCLWCRWLCLSWVPSEVHGKKNTLWGMILVAYLGNVLEDVTNCAPGVLRRRV